MAGKGDYYRVSLEDMIASQKTLNAYFEIFDRYKEFKPEAYAFALQVMGYKRMNSKYNINWLDQSATELHVYAKQKTFFDESGKALDLNDLYESFGEKDVSNDIKILTYSIESTLSTEGSTFLEIDKNSTLKENKSNYIPPCLAGMRIKIGQSEKTLDKVLLLDSSANFSFSGNTIEFETLSTNFSFNENVYSLNISKTLDKSSSEPIYRLKYVIREFGPENRDVTIVDEANTKILMAFAKAIKNDMIFSTVTLNGNTDSLRAADLITKRKITKQSLQDQLYKEAETINSEIKESAASYVLNSGRYKLNNGLVCDGLKCVPVKVFIKSCENLVDEITLSKLSRIEGFG